MNDPLAKPLANAPEAPARPPARPQSLRRELLAIAFLYAILSVLPLAIGLWLGTA